MRNIKLLIEYEGTDYAGWQVQKEEPSVQGTIIRALEKLTGERVNLIGASRTDAGVHALGQVANFHTSKGIPEKGMHFGLNSMLPEDIVIKEVLEVPEEFDSRRDSKGKTYIYRVLNRPYPSAVLRRFTWFVPKPLDIGLMREGARHFLGRKDFTSFHAVDSDALHSVREILSFEIREREEGLIEFEVKGTAFLRHMVRIMAGTLVTVGSGKIKPEEIEAILEAKDRTSAPLTAPPQGLFLVKVDF